MPHNETVALSGVIEHVFAHRFTLKVAEQTFLLDLGPKGAQAFALVAGKAVSLEGERRPSEIKVTRIAAEGGEPMQIAHKKPHHGHGPGHAREHADPALAMAAMTRAGWKVKGELHRKPKHFEAFARQGDGPWTELHVDFAGLIYKEKTADPAKWGARK